MWFVDSIEGLTYNQMLFCVHERQQEIFDRDTGPTFLADLFCKAYDMTCLPSWQRSDSRQKEVSPSFPWHLFFLEQQPYQTFQAAVEKLSMHCKIARLAPTPVCKINSLIVSHIQEFPNESMNSPWRLRKLIYRGRSKVWKAIAVNGKCLAVTWNETFTHTAIRSMRFPYDLYLWHYTSTTGLASRSLQNMSTAGTITESVFQKNPQFGLLWEINSHGYSSWWGSPVIYIFTSTLRQLLYFLGICRICPPQELISNHRVCLLKKISVWVITCHVTKVKDNKSVADQVPTSYGFLRCSREDSDQTFTDGTSADIHSFIQDFNLVAICTTLMCLECITIVCQVFWHRTYTVFNLGTQKKIQLKSKTGFQPCRICTRA